MKILFLIYQHSKLQIFGGDTDVDDDEDDFVVGSSGADDDNHVPGNDRKQRKLLN